MYRLFKTIEKILLTLSNLNWLRQEIQEIQAPHRLSSKQQSKSVFWIMNKEIDNIFSWYACRCAGTGQRLIIIIIFQWIICAIVKDQFLLQNIEKRMLFFKINIQGHSSLIIKKTLKRLWSKVCNRFAIFVIARDRKFARRHGLATRHENFTKKKVVFILAFEVILSGHW